MLITSAKGEVRAQTRQGGRHRGGRAKGLVPREIRKLVRTVREEGRIGDRKETGGGGRDGTDEQGVRKGARREGGERRV